MKAVIVLPTYNERENIIAVLDGLEKSIKQVHRYSISILVVDDSSPDGTKNLVHTYQKKHHNVYLLSGQKFGLGRALLRGMAYAIETLKADIVVQIDADLSHDPASLPSFFQALEDGADFVVGSRYIPGGSIPNSWSFQRKVFSILGNTIVRFGLGYSNIREWTGGYRAYKKDFYEQAKHEMGQYNGYVFQIAFLHKAVKRHAHVKEVPIHFTDRLFGHSKIAKGEYIRDVLAYVICQRLTDSTTGFFGKFLVVGTIGFIINTLILVLVVRIGFHPVIGSGIGAEIAIISNFILNNSWTFHARKIQGRNVYLKFLQFNMTSIGAIIIQAGSVWIGTYLFGIHTYFVWYVFGIGVGLVWNYLMYSGAIWKKSHE